MDAAGEVAVAVVVERAVVADDAVVGIERGRSDDKLVGGQRRAGRAPVSAATKLTGSYLLQAAFARGGAAADGADPELKVLRYETTRPIAPLPFGAAVPSLKNRSSISAWIRYIHFSARAARSW